MAFLSWFLGSSLASLVYFLWRFFKKKKERSSEPLFSKDDLFRYGIPLSLGFLLALIFYFCFPRFPWLNGSWPFFFLTLLLLFLHPYRFFPWERNRPSKKKIVRSCLLLLGVFLESFASNLKAYPLGGDSYTYEALGTSSLVSGSYVTLEDASIQIQKDSYFILSWGKEEKPKNIYLNFLEGNGATIKAKISFSTDGTNFSEAGAYLLDTTNGNSNVLALPTYPEGIIEQYRIDFSFEEGYYASPTNAILSSFSLNVPFRFHFSLLRFGTFSIVVLFFSSLATFLNRDRKGVSEKVPYLILGGFACVLILGTFFYMVGNVNDFATPYPISSDDLHAHISSSTGKTDIFVSLFDAFRKGRIDLDLAVDPKLLSLTNPWSPSERDAAHVSYYWDHAFYNGKYYSYYGPMPVILVSFPFYFLTGMRYALTAFGLETLGMAFLIPSFLFVLLEIFKLMQKKVDFLQYLFFAILGGVTSMMILAFTWKNGSYHEAIYHVPDIYGLAFFDLFFAFVLQAYRKRKLRILPLTLAGLSFVFLVFSRPNLFLGLLIALPFLFGVLCEKEVPFKKKIIDFLPMILILLIGGALACLYNYARFDSILEFGQSYQLNVADQRHLTYSLEKLLPAFFHFFCQGGNFYNVFPFISCTVQRYNFETTSLAPYVSSCFGLLGVPFFCLILFAPFLFWKKARNSEKAMGIITPFFLFLFAFTTYSKAGVCPRYLIELFHLATLLSVFAFLQLQKRVEDTPAQNWALGGGFLLMLASAFVCLCLNFDSFDGMKAGSYFGLLLRLKEAFFTYNF